MQMENIISLTKRCSWVLLILCVDHWNDMCLEGVHTSSCVWSNDCRCSCSLITHTHTHTCPAVLATEDVPTVCSAWIMNDFHQPTHLLLSPPSSSFPSSYIIELQRWDRNNLRHDAGLCSDSSRPDSWKHLLHSEQTSHHQQQPGNHQSERPEELLLGFRGVYLYLLNDW